jgi:8-hydroxy-5-deazaflavin:NADPH oxidoreductase
MTDRRTFLRLSAAALAASSLAPLVAAPKRLKIGTIGSGNVGGTLGRIWAKAGHEVMFSSLNLEQDQKLAASIGPNASAGTPKAAAAFGEVVLVSVPYKALPDVGKEVGSLLKGKIVIDTCNPFPSRDGEIANWAREKGAGVASAELLPGARLVRAFNAVSWLQMADASKSSQHMAMPMASDDAEAVQVVSGLVREVGYEPVLIGPLAMGRHLMPGTPLAGEHTPDEIRTIAATLR